MRVTVKFYATLRLALGIAELEFVLAQPETMRQFLQRVAAQVSGAFLDKLLDHDAIRKGTLLLVDGHNVLHLQGLETPLIEDCVVSIFPPAGGG